MAELNVKGASVQHVCILLPPSSQLSTVQSADLCVEDSLFAPRPRNKSLICWNDDPR